MSTTLVINGKNVMLEAVERKPSEVCFTLNGQRYSFHGTRGTNGEFLLEEGESRFHGTAWSLGKGAVKFQMGEMEAKVSPVVAATGSTLDKNPLSPLAPMPGLVRQVLVKKGERVTEGQPLAVMEAMKLQTTLKAGGNAIVEAILVKEGELVAEGAELVRLVAKK